MHFSLWVPGSRSSKSPLILGLLEGASETLGRRVWMCGQHCPSSRGEHGETKYDHYVNGSIAARTHSEYSKGPSYLHKGDTRSQGCIDKIQSPTGIYWASSLTRYIQHKQQEVQNITTIDTHHYTRNTRYKQKALETSVPTERAIKVLFHSQSEYLKLKFIMPFFFHRV